MNYYQDNGRTVDAGGTKHTLPIYMLSNRILNRPLYACAINSVTYGKREIMAKFKLRNYIGYYLQFKFPNVSTHKIQFTHIKSP
jgi:hypothetical protein